jgi:hypothetical protein
VAVPRRLGPHNLDIPDLRARRCGVAASKPFALFLAVILIVRNVRDA